MLIPLIGLTQSQKLKMFCFSQLPRPAYGFSESDSVPLKGRSSIFTFFGCEEDAIESFRNCVFASVYTSVMRKGGAVAQSVERATPVQEVPGSIPAVAARSLLVGSVSV